MTLTEAFKNVLKDGYTHERDGVSWKMIGSIMYFEESNGVRDWIRNLLCFPVLVKVKRWIWIPFGMSRSWKTARAIIERENPTAFIGYSHGAVLAALGSELTGGGAIVFGCPRFRIGGVFMRTLFVETPGDFIAKIPPFYQRNDALKLSGESVMPEGFNKWIWKLDHAPENYRQRLQGEK